MQCIHVYGFLYVQLIVLMFFLVIALLIKIKIHTQRGKKENSRIQSSFALVTIIIYRHAILFVITFIRPLLII